MNVLKNISNRIGLMVTAVFVMAFSVLPLSANAAIDPAILTAIGTFYTDMAADFGDVVALLITLLTAIIGVALGVLFLTRGAMAGFKWIGKFFSKGVA